MLATGSVQVPLLSKVSTKTPEHKTLEMKETPKHIFSDKSSRPHTDGVIQYKPESCVLGKINHIMLFGDGGILNPVHV